ncbi:MAG: rod shape-determining protein RodA [Pseudomonadales bacterium]|nr:rod shape-determining protein RodA [Pseudomonadales bacterium]
MQKTYQHQLPDFQSRKPLPGPLRALARIDLILIFLIVLLSGFGLIVLYSAAEQNPSIMIRQSSYLAAAFVVMFILAQIDPRHLQRLATPLFVVGTLLLIAVLLMGFGAKGAQRWLAIPGIPRFQPSELMKLAVPIMVASYLAKRTLPPKLKYLAISLIFIVVPVGLIAKQPDLGTSILIGASGLFVIFLAGVSWKILLVAITAGVASLPGIWFMMRDYQRQRVLTLLDPERDPLGAGWNTIQSKIAIGSGGMEGKGWLNGTQSHLDFLPEGHTDFIIAVLGEELGFLGFLFVMMLYLMIVSRGAYIALTADGMFNRLLAGSITLTFFVYVFVNIGMVSGLLPIVGVPLPLVSQGGTSLITLMAGFGILMSINSHRSLMQQ